jgi:F-type H+-transporting ATPase subunit gamma
MAGLKEIKNKIHSVKKTRKVTRAMEAVSAVKMRKAQERAKGARAYARSALRILSQVSSVVEFATHPLVAQSGSGATAVVLVTSDKGLAGSLNSAVLKTAERFIQNKDESKGGIKWLCIGKRAIDWAERREYDIAYTMSNVSDAIAEQELEELTQKVVAMQEGGEVRKVNIIYTNFKSTFEQEAVMRRVLPLSKGALDDIVDGILPQKGLGESDAISKKQETEKPVADYEIEPSRSGLLNEILPRLTNIVIFHSLLENKASEHSARMVAMKSATDKAGEVAMFLKRKFNKARQAAITAEIGEITSGLEAMK